jgi:hypothetical protein
MKKLLTTALLISLAVRSFSALALEISPFAELLVWQVSEESSSAWANVATLNESEFSFENNQFGFSPGFRGGIGFEPKSYFDTKAYWTYFSTKSQDSIPVGAHIVIPEFFSGFLSRNFFFGAEQDWRITMNVVNLEISHPYKVADHLSIRPALGVMGASLDQTISTLWQAELYNAHEKMTNDFLGFGPTFGISGEWEFIKQFSLVTDFSIAFLWGHWDISDVYTRPYVAFSLTPEATVITTELNDSAVGTLMLDYFLGIQWAPKTLPNMSIQLGYEMQFWSDQLRLTTFQQLPTHGDLTLQGGTCSISIDF